MKKSDIEEIIERRKVLVETATSEDQKKIYQGYLEFWQEKLGGKPVGKVAEPVVETEELIDDPTGVHEQLKESYEELFKLENPNKQAYYIREGKKLKTKAYTEFLNKNK